MRFPLLQGLLPFNRDRVAGDIVAGVTLAALGIPEVMGYTKISGTPVVTGLYTMLLPMIAFAVLGGSRHLVVAADSATAAILASMLAIIATVGTPEYVGLTSLVALVVAGMLVLARIFKLAFLADFLSRSALIGFLSGVGLQVAGGELAGLVGLAREGHGTIVQVASVFERIGSAHGMTFAISAAVIIIIAGGAHLAPRFPGPLVAVIGAIVASAALDLAARGIATIGTVPSGLPALALPALHPADFYEVLACATSCFIVIVAQSAATARAYAMRYEERPADNLDLVGLAGANAAAAITGTFVVNGSPTKTEMIDTAGGRSQVAHLTTALLVLMVLLFLTRPLSFLPSAVLSAIVFMIGVKLIDARGLRDLYRLGGREFRIALLTAATVVAFTVMHGIAVAVLLSLIDQVRHAYRPRTRVVARGADGLWHGAGVEAGRFAAPGVVIYRFEANLFYANANRFMEEVLGLVSRAPEPVRALVIDAAGIDDVDYTAGKMLLQVRDQLAKRHVAIAMVAAHGPVRRVLQSFGLSEGTNALRQYPTLDAAVAAMGPPAAC
jgi:MFS superfamily sulfate permease-like transporter